MDTASSEGHDHIGDLPDEIFALILNLIPIKQVVRCTIVSKRWDAACRYIIRTRQSLVIGYDDPSVSAENEQGWDWERPSQQMDGITLTDKSLVSAMMKTMNQMVDLNQLSVDTSVVSPAEIIPFIRKFSQQLTMLEIDFAISVIGADAFPHLTRLRCRHFDASSSAAFPKLAELFVFAMKRGERLPKMRLPSLKKLIVKDFGAGHAVRGIILANAKTLTVLQMTEVTLRLDRSVVFPNLMEVVCREVKYAGRCPFPALTHLTVGWPVTAEFLMSLPADHMLRLEVVVIEEGKDSVSAISKMKNLKRLKLGGTFSNIFDDMHHLEEVKLDSIGFRNLQDRVIATLANQNPKLTHVDFSGIPLTDAALTLLAQLQHLTDVSLCCHGNVITTYGVLTLLRGSSRNVIRNLFFYNRNVDFDQVTREIRLMCDERETTFHANGMTSCFFEYEIHA